MKFLNANGQIEDGTPLSDEEAQKLEEVEEFLHVMVCKGSYHPGYEDQPRCKKAANVLITCFDITGKQGNSFAAVLADLKPKPIPAVPMTPIPNDEPLSL